MQLSELEQRVVEAETRAEDAEDKVSKPNSYLNLNTARCCLNNLVNDIHDSIEIGKYYKNSSNRFTFYFFYNVEYISNVLIK